MMTAGGGAGMGFVVVCAVAASNLAEK